VKKQIQYYEKLREKFRTKREIVGWGSKKSQQMRFNVIKNYIKENNCKNLLDIGCGRGDLVNYLNKNQIKIKYIGLDINHNFIQIAKKRNPKNFFRVGNFLNTKIKSFDLIFISGIFNLKMKNHEKFMKTFIKKAFKKTKKILIFNCLSANAKIKKKLHYYINPFEISKNYNINLEKLIIDHSYADHDVSFILFK